MPSKLRTYHLSLIFASFSFSSSSFISSSDSSSTKPASISSFLRSFLEIKEVVHGKTNESWPSGHGTLC